MQFARTRVARARRLERKRTCFWVHATALLHHMLLCVNMHSHALTCSHFFCRAASVYMHTRQTRPLVPLRPPTGGVCGCSTRWRSTAARPSLTAVYET